MVAAPVPFVNDVDFQLYVGDVREVLAGLPSESVDCAATSPPFFGLRDYGTGSWDGGDPSHEHDTVGARGGRGGSGTLDKRDGDAMPSRVPARVCSCGAEYDDPQIGLESSPDEWAEKLPRGRAAMSVASGISEDGRIVWTNTDDPHAVIPPLLRVDPDVLHALATVLSDTLPPSAAGERHLEDAIATRDRLLALIEKSYDA